MRHKQSFGHSSQALLEAVETLSNIAELHMDAPRVEREEQQIALEDMPIVFNAVHFLNEKNALKISKVVQTAFRTILGYLKRFYRKEYGKFIEHDSIEGIKTIMVLVGEAAKKLDTYFHLFLEKDIKSIKEFREYKELWNFYRRKIAPLGVQEYLTKWIKTLPIKTILDTSKEKVAFPASNDHFIDLEMVHKDKEYELLYIRKQDGSRFFHTHLLRNMKLITNFEEYFGASAQESMSKEFLYWEDVLAKHFAQAILKESMPAIDVFYNTFVQNTEIALANNIYNALIALMLAAYQNPELRLRGHKGASNYVEDFLRFMRNAISSSDYKKNIAHLEKEAHNSKCHISKVVEDIMRGLYAGTYLTSKLSTLLQEIRGLGKSELEHGIHAYDSLVQRLSHEYELLYQGTRFFSHAPLLRDVERLQEGYLTGFDPLLLKNMPTKVLKLISKGKHIDVLRIPTPTSQESIDKANINEEFKNFLRAYGNEKKLHLLFNMQDRNDWKEQARALAIEDLQKKEEFASTLSVISLGMHGDFYNQEHLYKEMNNASLFIEHLVEHVESANSGYFYPISIANTILLRFHKGLARGVHEVFFSGKEVLSREERLGFIELFHIFLVLKIIEIVQPDSCSFTCKDGIDFGLIATSELFLLLKYINDTRVSSAEEEFIQILIFALPLVLRGRLIFKERFARLKSFVKWIEKPQEEEAAQFRSSLLSFIVSLFDTGILRSTVEVSTS